jgi:hypothetical protein
MLTEYERCAESPVYFIENYVKRECPINGIVPFKLLPHQIEILTTLRDNRKVCLTKGRQIGASITELAYALHMALFNQDKSLLFFAPKFSIGANMKQRLQVMYDNLPEELKVSIKFNSAMQLTLMNRSQIMFASHIGAGCGESVDFLSMSEFAFFPNAEEIYTAAIPMTCPSGQILISSTPNGIGTTERPNMFYRLATEDNHFAKLAYDWTTMGKTEEWAEKVKGMIGATYFAQEYELRFL